MSAGLRRGLADLACRVLQATLPPSLHAWGWAVRCEAANIPDDTKALLFTLDSLCGLMPRAVASHLLHPFSERSATMNIFNATVHRPRVLGIICVIGAVALGLSYMALAGAPTRYLAINVGALALGLTMLALLRRTNAKGQQWTGAAIVAMAGTLLATALFGSAVDGATRWVHLGALAVQPSSILLPVMLVAFSGTRSVLATAGIVIAAAGLALQPDRAMAGMLALCLVVLAITRRDRRVVLSLIAGLLGFAATLTRADTLPAVPYVDQIFYSSFNVHVGAGLAVLGGTALLLVPAIVGWTRDPANRAAYAVFGATWFGAILAAALGNYPTPIVGYGGSAILGYALSLLALPRQAEVHAGVAPPLCSRSEQDLDRHLLVATA